MYINIRIICNVYYLQGMFKKVRCQLNAYKRYTLVNGIKVLFGVVFINDTNTCF